MNSPDTIVSLSVLFSSLLITTISTLVLVGMSQPLVKIRWSQALAAALASALFLHVSTWFMIGVVTPVTFILFGLGTTCLLINFLAVVYRRNIAQSLSAVWSRS